MGSPWKSLSRVLRSDLHSQEVYTASNMENKLYKGDKTEAWRQEVIVMALHEDEEYLNYIQRGMNKRKKYLDILMEYNF